MGPARNLGVAGSNISGDGPVRGDHDPVLHRLRLRLVSWTRRGFDTVEKTPNRIYRRLVRNLAAADILLLHDGGERDTTHRSTALLDVLPRVLAEIKKKGLEAVPLP